MKQLTELMYITQMNFSLQKVTNNTTDLMYPYMLLFFFRKTTATNIPKRITEDYNVILMK
jgi:hypothetical protein